MTAHGRSTPDRLDQRLAFVVLAGELAGPTEALVQIEQNRSQLARQKELAAPQSVEVLTILKRLYSDYEQARWNAPSVTAEERSVLKGKLGWFGSLALVPRISGDEQHVLAEGTNGGPASRSRSGLANLPGSRSGDVRPVGRGRGRSARRDYVLPVGPDRQACLGRSGRHTTRGRLRGDIRLWMFLLTAISLAAAALPRAGQNQLLYSAAASLLSLSALAWPVLRGVPWARVRLETGLYAGKTPAA